MEKIKSININETFDKATVKAHMNTSLVNVVGVAYSSFVIMTKFGENTGLKGDFFATNLLTGEVFESEAAFLTSAYTEQVAEMLRQPGNLEVHINVNISATPSDKNNFGYAWVADTPRTEAMQSRREAMKLEVLKNAQKLLTAPRAAATAEAKAVKEAKRA